MLAVLLLLGISGYLRTRSSPTLQGASPAPPALSFSLVIFAIAPLDGRVRAAAVL